MGMTELYTPFLADVGKTLGAAERQKTEAQLAGSAYMGDDEAMQQLMQINPGLGIQIQEKKQAEQQQGLQQQATAETRHRKVYMENRELMDNIFKQASNIDDYEEARAFVQRKFEENKPILGDLADASGYTPEVHQQMQDVYKDLDTDPEKSSVNIPGQGTKIVRKSGKVEFIPASTEERQAFMRSQQEEITQATTKAEQVETAKLLAKSKQEFKSKVTDAAMAAQEQMPRIDNMERLAALATTGTFGEQRVAIKRAFGIDVANEEEFVAESNRIILDAASSLKGALSDRENAYLEAVGPGIGKSVEGNLRIIKNLKIIAQNSIDRKKALQGFKGDPIDFDFKGKPFFEGGTPKEAAKKKGIIEKEVYWDSKKKIKVQIINGIPVEYKGP